MKKTLVLASMAALVGACSSVPPSGPQEWGYKPGEQAPRLISEAEAETLTAQVAEIKAKRREIADGMRTVSDPAVRAQRLRTIEEFTQQLQPLEYRLRAAGRPVPPG